jgi:hypothetical protein
MQLAIYLSVLFTVVATPLGAVAVDARPAEPVGAQFQRAELDADRVLLRFDVREDGAAVASVEYRFALAGANDTAAFDRLRRDVAANRTQYLDRFERRVGQTVRTAENATNRPMRVTNATVRAETRQLPRPYGVVSYTFTWHGFARVEEGELGVGDALAGLYLDEGVQLQISWPESYDVRTAHESVAEQRDSAAIWTGPLWFDRDGPRLVLVRGGGGIEPAPVALLGLSVVFALSGLAFWWRGRRYGAGDAARPTPDRSPATNADGGEPVATTTSEPAADPELLSNEERLLREIERRGGRVKQQELVSALGWSDAKVSRAVSNLRDRGAVEGFRLGNENVLSLPTGDQSTEEEP